jgi:Na+/citrate or Na+/malate symporter
MEKTKYKVTAWIIGLLGVWLILAGFIVKVANANRFDDLIVGLAVVFFGMLLSRVREVRGWLSYIFGAWMIVAAFIPAFLVGTGHVWNNVIVGILIAAAGFSALGGKLAKSTIRGLYPRPHFTMRL